LAEISRQEQELRTELERCMRDKGILIAALQAAGIPIPQMMSMYGALPPGGGEQAPAAGASAGLAPEAPGSGGGGGGGSQRYPQFSQQTPEQRARVREYTQRTTEEAENLARQLEFSPAGRQAFVMEKLNVSYMRALDGLPYESPQWNSMDFRYKNF
jgi:hypothetical protein